MLTICQNYVQNARAMSNRISVGTQQAIRLWLDNPKLTPSAAARLAGIAHTTILRAIERLKLKRK